jgi:hypothetical protein
MLLSSRLKSTSWKHEGCVRRKLQALNGGDWTLGKLITLEVRTQFSYFNICQNKEILK